MIKAVICFLVQYIHLIGLFKAFPFGIYLTQNLGRIPHPEGRICLSAEIQ